ncbi:deoxyhypusine synthase isoform X2 [Alligator sinensis]|uniref:Deoxyhypusine synthase n=1 Tax=Alligator sinensis TaxID=38654 RepID=A0A1U8D4X4_ALLSI|nr:deoxyhypusine synthase isoform X2 [Alligator sinensis]
MLHCGRMESQNGGIQPYGHSARQRMRDPCGAGTEQNGGAQLSGSATCTGLNRDTGHGSAEAMEGLPAVALTAVLKPSEALPPESLPVRGYDFDHGLDHHALLRSFLTTGFQATSFGQAVREIHRMIDAKLEPLGEVAEEENHADLNPCQRPPTGCTIFLGYTSNLISSGIRETIRYLVQHNMVDVLVTTAGGVEEDLIKCLAPTYIGDFSLRGKELRQSGINRIGNLLVPNDNYCKFEDWLMPILDQMVAEQDTESIKWTPSKMIARLGKEINNPESVYYWAQKNNIPVLSPALTDGSLGDMIFFHSYKKPGLVLDIVEDLRLINTQAMFAKKTGMIILGGGLVKHHIANANLMEFDGSDSGARPDEAVSWGKIRTDAKPVKVYADASLVFPLLVAETFVPRASTFTSDKQHD